MPEQHTQEKNKITKSLTPNGKNPGIKFRSKMAFVKAMATQSRLNTTQKLVEKL